MDTFPLVSHASPGDTVAWRHGQPVSVAQFVADVARLAAALPPGGFMLNACGDRYRFAVGLSAALVAGKVSLLPPSHTAESVRQMRAFAPDVFCLADAPSSIELPLFRYDDAVASLTPPWEARAAPVPRIPADRTVAFVFTSGSTGTPVPHRKQWGALVRDVRAEAQALALPAGARPQILGTVPPQHMYGIESTVLLAMHSGGAFSAAHPFYPADIAAELGRLPQPRMLVTTPVHLRALLDAGVAVPQLALLLSATAPLSAELAERAERTLDAPLQEIYGSTETGQIATRRSTHTSHWSLLPGIALAEREGRFWAQGGHVAEPTPLGDVLELESPGAPGARFLLHGRIGDLVNIAGKRNSLAYLNHQLLAIEGVRDGVFLLPGHEPADGVARLAAFVVAPGLTAAQVRAGLRERIDPIFMPRPLVLLDALPRNSTGKLTRETLDALARRHLRAAPAAGLVPDPQAQTLVFAPGHPAFAGHFPGAPIVPGVLLLDAALHAVETQGLAVGEIASAKFLSPVGPGRPVTLACTAQAGRARFEIMDAAGQPVASGQLQTEAPR
ncbi:AMP-binding protein [Ramlibacter tataouinensis]|uniref:Candidate acyl-coenzyme A synthetases/AMP-(Fatty) acid ligase n=1 Tax=Ramlibacter tataouinensis (strain ATCC BAA-407 / DSM 14655 / LMG 21543 / TTB310) TaxID=365046 RepID=F5Y4K1_RAMTT|nr:AMP-binding protein [Ramlibacter tataouinensis]AEG91319.1 Candidate acyl-coenzyme A synthetases/AMP-(fatty) acid ligase [Ramlibacter tataouinensis TTB310]